MCYPSSIGLFHSLGDLLEKSLWLLRLDLLGVGLDFDIVTVFEGIVEAELSDDNVCLCEIAALRLVEVVVLVLLDPVILATEFILGRLTRIQAAFPLAAACLMVRLCPSGTGIVPVLVPLVGRSLLEHL